MLQKRIINILMSQQLDFERFLVSEYFRHGSINKVFYFHHFNLPISYAGYDRILSKYGVIKSAGPNSKLTESLRMLSLVADYKLSLEKVYEKYAPHKLWVSTNTLHRILHYTRLGLTRRQGTALLISTKTNKHEFLMGNDQSIKESVLGKNGDLSLPMGHSKTGESPRDSIARVLQQEVFSDLTIEGKFPFDLIPKHPKPEMYINIADIRVSVYKIELDTKRNFSSYKLHNHAFYSLHSLDSKKLRPGVIDIIQNYLLNSNSVQSEIPRYSSALNLALAEKKSP